MSTAAAPTTKGAAAWLRGARPRIHPTIPRRMRGTKRGSVLMVAPALTPATAGPHPVFRGPRCRTSVRERLARREAGCRLSRTVVCNLCYATRTTVGSAAFVPVSGVNLVTATESRQFDSIRRGDLCTPANANGQGTVDPATQLVGYTIDPV